MADGRFDDRQIQWSRLDGIAHLEYTVLSIDPPRQTADVLFRSNTKNLKILTRHLDKHHPETRVIEG